jgi:hypothetical protein
MCRGDHHQLSQTIGQYLENGTITKMLPEQRENTRYWVPIFGRQKKGSDKVRLITDLRAVNQCQHVPHHKTENWATMLNIIKDNKKNWALTMDLKDWFHHLQLHPKQKRWMRIMHQGQAYQLEGMPFGWSHSPWWSQKLANPISGWLHQQGVPHCWHVDDVMVMGNTKEEAEERAWHLVQQLNRLGIRVNKEKTMKEASQTVQYLGHIIDFKENKIQPLPDKVLHAKKLVRKQQAGRVYTPKHLAALAGNLLDMVKSNISLRGLP